MSGADAIVGLIFKGIGWMFYLMVLGPWVAWPRAIWRRLYPLLKKQNMQFVMWLPLVLVAAWFALDFYFRRPPTIDIFGFDRGLRRMWSALNASALEGLVAFSKSLSRYRQDMGAFPFEVTAPAIAFIASTLAAGPLHMLGLWLFPGTVKKYVSHGSALWGGAQNAQAAGSLIPTGYVGGLMMGRLQDGVPKKHDARLRVFRHVLTCAPTGAGKGVGCVIPNLLEYPGSVVCLDVKGENYAVTAHARAKMGQEVFCLDPFGITGTQGHRLNWLDAICLDSEECVSDAASLAETLVVRSGHGDSHWDDAAAHLLQGLLLHVAGLTPEARHMGSLRQLLTLPEAKLTIQMQELASEDNASRAYGVIARSANAFLSKADRERSGVLSTAQRHTGFLDDPRIVRSLSATDIDFAALKNRPMTVYIVLPPDKLAAYSRVARASLGLAIKAMMRQPGKPRHNVLFLLDEFAQLGHFSAVEDSIAIMRGYGGIFWLLVQDLSQLRAVYPKADTFLSNSVLQAFGTQDYQTARYLSHMLGSETVLVASEGTSRSESFNHNSTGASQSYSCHGRELLTPDEIRRMPTSRVVVLEQGQPPHLLQRLDYRTDSECRGQARENPMHRQIVRAS